MNWKRTILCALGTALLVAGSYCPRRYLPIKTIGLTRHQSNISPSLSR